MVRKDKADDAKYMREYRKRRKKELDSLFKRQKELIRVYEVFREKDRREKQAFISFFQQVMAIKNSAGLSDAEFKKRVLAIDVNNLEAYKQRKKKA